jgi:hypothetical protein
MPGKIRLLPGLLLFVFFAFSAFAVSAQTPPAAVTLSVNAGYDGRFRSEQWMPVRIRISNDGEDIAGRLVIRPETSGTALNSSFSTPVELASGARQSVFLYVTARSFATQFRVEFIDNAGNIVVSENTPVRSILPQDQLYVVITQSASGSVDLTGAKVGGYDAFQANWQVDNLPDKPEALDAIDIILFSDVDSGGLSTSQQQALSDWVTRGGHLMVTGGTNWQSTAAGLTDLLPLTPDDSLELDNLAGLATLGGALNMAQELSAQAVIATGDLRSDAEILAANPEGEPLLLRRRLGAGTVDYLAADPGAQPLRDWDGMQNLWFSLASSTAPRPSWANGFYNWDRAGQASEILPGYNILPDVLPLCGFLVAYIALVGPINYVILNRLNRREYAWVTIPILIIVFSALAWAIGFNLRGNRAILSRLAVVQSWPDSDQARVDGVVGMLSPRRGTYTLTATQGDFLRPIVRTLQSGTLLSSNIQAITDIQQSDTFSAQDFPVDASFIASFNTSGTVEKPAVSGQASLTFDGGSGQQTINGSVRNDTEAALLNPVILSRGVVFQLGATLEPGDIQPFSITLSGEGPPSPSPMQHSVFNPGALFGASAVYLDTGSSEQSVMDIMGERYDQTAYYSPPGADVQAQENRRQQLFLSSFILEPYNYYGRTNTGRGNQVYLAGWSDESPLAFELEGAAWDARDTTLYLVELETEYTPPRSTVLISTDQFTWTLQERIGLSEVTPTDISLQPGDDVTFRFTPLPDMVLNEVEELTLRIDRTNNVRLDVPMKLWDWDDGAWVDIQVLSENDTSIVNTFPIRNPDRFLGPQNAVLIRLVADDTGGYLNIDNLSVEQRGQF